MLVEKTDRLYRNLKDWVTVDELDVEIHFPKEGVVLSRESRSSEKFMHGIKVLMAKNYIDNLSEEARKGMQEKAEQGIWPTDRAARLSQRRRPGRQEDHRARSRRRADHLQAVRVVRDRPRFAEGSGAEGAGGGPRLSQERRQGAGEHRPHDPAQSALHRLVRVERQADTRASTSRWSRSNCGSACRACSMAASPRSTERVQARLRLLRTDRLRHCGCSVVGEIKKQRYVYYHCTGYADKCQGNPASCRRKYVREEVLEQQFTELLGRLQFDDEVLEWVRMRFTPATPTSGASTKRRSSGCRPNTTGFSDRIHAMYVDKLDGRVDAAFFDKMSAEWREEQNRCLREIERHQDADKSYLDEGVQILELARNAQRLFEQQEPREKRRLLNFRTIELLLGGRRSGCHLPPTV